MGRYQHVVKLEKGIVRRRRLHLCDIESRHSYLILSDRPHQRGLIDYRAAACVDKHCGRLHKVEFTVSDHVVGASVEGNVQGNDVGGLQQVVNGESRKVKFTFETLFWPNYVAAGAERLLVARVVEKRSELQGYRDAIPGAEPIVCLLTASIDTMQQRLRPRESGMFRWKALARSEVLAAILETSNAEYFRVDNNEGRDITEVAREVLSRAGWLNPSS